jgi:LacI family transcriptional regulator
MAQPRGFGNGENRAGMSRRSTIDDVARLANVHKATVSRALNARTQHQIGSATVERVRAAAEQLGYVPNAMARGLRTASSMTVGVVIPDLTNPLFPPMIRGIEAELQQHGYTALLANTDDSEAGERAALGSLIARQVDGLIVASGHREYAALQDAYEAGVRAVLLNRDAGDVPYPLVGGDDAHGIRQSVDHLVELGHRVIVHLAGPPRLSTSVDRRRAFEAACAERPGVHGWVVEAEALTIDAGQRAARVAFDASPRPTAVIAGNDLIALGALRAGRELGLECPRDVSVIGFNDMLFAEEFTPPLTTVRVPTVEMGAAAGRMLLQQLADPASTPLPVRLPVELVVRGSTAVVPT